MTAAELIAEIQSACPDSLALTNIEVHATVEVAVGDEWKEFPLKCDEIVVVQNHPTIMKLYLKL